MAKTQVSYNVTGAGSLVVQISEVPTSNGHYRLYVTSATATPAAGWRFSSWGWFVHSYMTGSEESPTGSTARWAPGGTTGTWTGNAGLGAFLEDFSSTLICSAVFVKSEGGGGETTYVVTTSVSPIGAGSTTGAGVYSRGETAQMRAAPDENHTFIKWVCNTDGTVITFPEFTLSVYRNQYWTAYFREITNLIVRSDSGPIVRSGNAIVRDA